MEVIQGFHNTSNITATKAYRIRHDGLYFLWCYLSKDKADEVCQKLKKIKQPSANWTADPNQCHLSSLERGGPRDNGVYTRNDAHATAWRNKMLIKPILANEKPTG